MSPYIDMIPGTSMVLPYLTCTNLMIATATVVIAYAIIKGIDIYRKGECTLYTDAIADMASSAIRYVRAVA